MQTSTYKAPIAVLGSEADFNQHAYAVGEALGSGRWFSFINGQGRVMPANEPVKFHYGEHMDCHCGNSRHHADW
jgi:hypothetical protein